MAVISAILLCAGLVGIDQIIKLLVINNLKPIQYVDVIDGILRFRYVENTGAIIGAIIVPKLSIWTKKIMIKRFNIYSKTYINIEKYNLETEWLFCLKVYLELK